MKKSYLLFLLALGLAGSSFYSCSVPGNRKATSKPQKKETYSLTVTSYTSIEAAALRETPSQSAGLIRNLEVSEKVSFLEAGSTEVINGKNGRWVRVLTKELETGWVFDAFFKKSVEQKNLTKHHYSLLELDSLNPRKRNYDDTCIEGFISFVFFLNTRNQDEVHIAQEKEYLLKGLVIPRSDRVEIRNDYFGNVIYQKEFSDFAHPGYFEAAFSVTDGTMVYGTNRYYIRMYIGDDYIERYFSLRFVSSENPVVIDITGKEDSFDKNLLTLSLFPYDTKDFNIYRFRLQKGDYCDFFLKPVPGETNIHKMPGMIRYVDTGRNIRIEKEVPIDFSYGFLPAIQIRRLDDGDFILYGPGYFEGCSGDKVYFNYDSATLTVISGLLKEVVKDDFFPQYRVEVEGNELVVTEYGHKFCYKEAGEKYKTFKFDKKTLALLSISESDGIF